MAKGIYYGLIVRKVGQGDPMPLYRLEDIWLNHDVPEEYSKVGAVSSARMIANAAGAPVRLYWSSLFDGKLSAVQTVKPSKKNPATPQRDYGLSKSIPNPFEVRGFIEKDEDGFPVARTMKMSSTGRYLKVRKPVVEQVHEHVFRVEVPRLKPAKGKVYKFTHSGFRTLGYTFSITAAKNAAEDFEHDVLKKLDRKYGQDLYGTNYDPRIAKLRYSKSELANFKRLATEKAYRLAR